MPSPGLSPRVREKLRQFSHQAPPCGSIPACAGEAGWALAISAGQKVYPRVCGGSSPPDGFADVGSGLSPRVRGKRRRVSRRPGCRRSIPACAGEAPNGAGRRTSRRVYPRVCGGSTAKLHPAPAEDGLSPRVRGKPGGLLVAAANARSIPACAGEAPFRGWANGIQPVYPRVCGGSEKGYKTGRWSMGLSPRVRGKPARPAADAAGSGSIPACAGEAVRAAAGRRAWRVYPRVCGGS